MHIFACVFKHTAGLDAAMYLCFLRLAFQIMIAASLYGFAVLIPIIRMAPDFSFPDTQNSSTKLAGAEEQHLFACAMVGKSVYHARSQRLAAILGALGPGVPLHIADTLPDTLELSSLSSPSPPFYFGQPSYQPAMQ